MVIPSSAQTRKEMQDFFSDQEYIKTYSGIDKQSAGKYFFNWPLISGIMAAYLKAKYKFDMRSNPYIHVPSGFEALRDAILLRELPEIKNVEIPWHQVKEKMASELPTLKKQLLIIFIGSPNSARQYLENLEIQTENYNQQLRDAIKSNSDRNIEAIKKRTSAGEGIASALKAARDLSADTLCYGFGLIPGPAGYAAALAGSTLKGVAKYQDEGGVRAGVAHGIGELALSATPIEKYKMFVVVASGVLDTTTNIIAGWETDNVNIPEHGVNGIAKIAIEGGVEKLFASGKLGTFFKKMPLPLKLNLQKSEADLMKNLMQKATEKDATESTKRMLQAAFAKAPLADRSVSGIVRRAHTAIIKL